MIGGSKQPNMQGLSGIDILRNDHKLYQEEASSEIYLLTYGKEEFCWTKIDLELPSAIAYCSAQYLKDMKAVVVVGGINTSLSARPLLGATIISVGNEFSITHQVLR